MKLRSLICVSAVAAASAAFALDGANTFARLKVTSDVKNSIIAIPFAGCGESTAEIYVTNLVMTTGLANGDTLMYKEGDNWYAWEISNGAWQEITTSTTKGGMTFTPAANATMLDCGKACWLIRNNPGAYYLYGQVTNVMRSVTVAGAAEGMAYGYTIIAKPSESSDLDLNTWKGEGKGIGTGDTILVPTASGTGQITYKYNGSAWMTATQGVSQKTSPRTGEISYVTNTTWTAIQSSTTIPAGKGFMYGRKAAAGTTLVW